MHATRRRFLQSVTSAAALELTSLSGFRSLCAMGAEEAAIKPEHVQYTPDIEPLVRLIEETPREKCVPAIVEQMRRGLSYRQFLTAAFLATIRKQNSHHAAFLVYSAHRVSLDLRPEEITLPLFWAVDGFKWQQQNFPTPQMLPLKGSLPSAAKAGTEFHEAMAAFDSERSERALIAVVRNEGPQQAMQHLWPYGCRDGSVIGHRAICVTNCGRLLETIGWQHAEPVLRFIVWNLYAREGRQDQYYPANVARADAKLKEFSPGWTGGQADPGATAELLSLLLQGKSEPACELAARQLAGNVGAQAIWDAVHVAASELMLLHNGSEGMQVRPLHVNTSMNALHYTYRANASERVRCIVLLQAVAWVADFIRVERNPKPQADAKPIELDGAPIGGSDDETVAEVFSTLPPKTMGRVDKAGNRKSYEIADPAVRFEMSKKVFALTKEHPAAIPAYIQATRSFLCRKATVEAHEYKFVAALFEDVPLVSPPWQPRLLAASARFVHGKQSPDSPLIEQAREALRGAS